MGTKGNRIISDIAVVDPATALIPCHTDHARKRGRKNVCPPWRGRSDKQAACGVRPGNDLAQPFAMVSICSPEAQINDVHLLRYCPAERGFEEHYGGGEAIRENLDRIEFDPRRLGSEDTG